MKNGISLVMTILNHYKCKDCTFFRVESNIDVKTSFFFFLPVKKEFRIGTSIIDSTGVERLTPLKEK